MIKNLLCVLGFICVSSNYAFCSEKEVNLDEKPSFTYFVTQSEGILKKPRVYQVGAGKRFYSSPTLALDTRLYAGYCHTFAGNPFYNSASIQAGPVFYVFKEKSFSPYVGMYGSLNVKDIKGKENGERFQYNWNAHPTIGVQWSNDSVTSFAELAVLKSLRVPTISIGLGY